MIAELSVAESAERAMAALRRHASSPTANEDGMIAATLLALELFDDDRIGRLAKSYLARDGHYGRTNPFRYRWTISFLGEAGDPTYDIGPHEAWWRPLETELRAEHPRAYARRLALPLVLGTQLDLWSRISQGGGTHSGAAERLLADARPQIEHEVARAIEAADPWADTLMLWQLTSHPGAFDMVRGLLFALAIRYGTIAERTGGIVHGARHPFFDMPLVSATAQLALGLWHFGIYPSLLPKQLAFVRDSRRDGGWGDPGQPADVMTTLAAADLLLALDPSFEADETVSFFMRRQEPEGWWRALDPEVPWLTAAVVDWMRRAALPFPDRFAWPEVALWQRDYVTGLPTMAFFAGLSDALARSGDGLAGSSIEVAFCDLAGFGSFNTRHGQALGDEVLRAFGESLAGTSHLVIRIGGDELLVIGRPTQLGTLEPALRSFLDQWPQELARRLPDVSDAVRPRIVLGRGPAGALRATHNELGRVIGEVKAASPEVHGPGVLVWR